MRGGTFHGGRRDTSEPEVRAVVEREFHGTFQPLNLHDGPDAIVGLWGIDELWEIKTGNAKLRPGQAEWHKRWQGRPVQVIRNAAQARKRCRMLKELAGDTRIQWPTDPVSWEDAHEQQEAAGWAPRATGGKDPEAPA